MYKVEDNNTGQIIKSHYIEEICKFVIDNPQISYQFYIGYKPYSYTEFLKKILLETRDFALFFSVYTSLNYKKTLIEYTSNNLKQILCQTKTTI